MSRRGGWVFYTTKRRGRCYGCGETIESQRSCWWHVEQLKLSCLACGPRMPEPPVRFRAVTSASQTTRRHLH